MLRTRLGVLLLFGLMTLPAYKALRHPGLISGHDSVAAVFKTMEMKQALLDGHFPVRWSKRLDYGLGMPTFTFTYNLPYYAAAGLSLLGPGEVNSVKYLLAATFPLGGFFMYLWLSRRFPAWLAVVGGLLYTLVPYHFLNVYVRSALGEAVAGMFVPLSFWGLDKSKDNLSPVGVVIAAVTIVLVGLSHQFYPVLFGPLWVVFFYLPWQPGRFWAQTTRLLAVFLLAAGLAAYYWIPAVRYLPLTYLSQPQEYFLGHDNFPSLSQLLIPAWGYGDLRQNYGQGIMSVQLGVVNLAIIVAAGLGLTRLKVNRKQLSGLLLAVVAITFMVLKPSLFVWKLLPFLQSIQFPWRLLAVLNFLTAVLGGLLLKSLNQRLSRRGKFLAVISLVLLLWAVNRPYWKVGSYRLWEDPTQSAGGFPGTLTMLLEELPRWHVVRQESHIYFQSRLPVGTGEIRDLVWKTNHHKFETEMETAGVMSDKTHYWPGWRAFVDGVEVELLDPYAGLSEGLITFAVPPGRHVVEVKLFEPPVNKIGNAVTIASLVGVTWWVIHNLRQKRGQTNNLSLTNSSSLIKSA